MTIIKIFLLKLKDFAVKKRLKYASEEHLKMINDISFYPPSDEDHDGSIFFLLNQGKKVTNFFVKILSVLIDLFERKIGVFKPDSIQMTLWKLVTFCLTLEFIIWLPLELSYDLKYNEALYVFYFW